MTEYNPVPSLFNVEFLPFVLKVSASIAVICVFAGCQGASTVRSQAIPSDLVISAVSGGLDPWSENQSLRITTDGTGLFSRFRPGDIGADPLESSTFSINQESMVELWQEIQRTDFFSLDAEFADSSIVGGSFIALEIAANEDSHRVRVTNRSVSTIELLIALINRFTPDGYDLVYTAPDVLKD